MKRKSAEHKITSSSDLVVVVAEKQEIGNTEINRKVGGGGNLMKNLYIR